MFPELISIPRFERLQEHFQRLPERPPLLQKLRAAVAEADGEAELYVVRQAVTRRKRHETADSKLLMKQIQLATSNTLFLLEVTISVWRHSTMVHVSILRGGATRCVILSAKESYTEAKEGCRNGVLLRKTLITTKCIQL